jgi:SnoaL-like domain
METADIVDIYQLEAFCHHAVDHKDQSLFPLVFTEDARFDGRLCGGPLYVGIEAIKGFFAEGKPPHPAAHHMTNCWVREENGRVLVKMKWMVPDRVSGRMFGGENDDWVVRTADGWRIKERVATVRYPEGNVMDGGTKSA